MSHEHDRNPIVPSALRERATLSNAETAAYVGVCERTLKRWWQAGEFPAPVNLATHGHRRFRLDDVERWKRGEWKPEVAHV